MGDSLPGIAPERFNEQQIRQLQHEIKTHVQQFSKDIVGKGSDTIKCTIYDDLLILRGSGFLTDMEVYLSRTPTGCERIRASRLEVIEHSNEDFKNYLEEKLGAKELHRVYNVEPVNNYWIDIHVFDRSLA